MKAKILIITAVMILATSIFSVKCFAQEKITSANITITASKNEYNPNETAIFTVHLSNLNATKGIFTFGAELDYNSNVLELEKIEGCNGWSNDNTKSKKFATIRDLGSSQSANDEDIVKIYFKVLEVSSDTKINVNLKNVDMSNGGSYKKSLVTGSTVTIKPKASSSNPGHDEPQPSKTPEQDKPTPSKTPEEDKPTPSKTPGSDNKPTPSKTPSKDDGNEGSNTPDSDSNNKGGDNQSSNNNNGGNSSSNSGSSNSNSYKSNSSSSSDKTTSKSKLPALGGIKGTVTILIVMVAGIATMFFIKMNLLNKKIRRKNTRIYGRHNENN